tara:strand:+ start:586 stop:1476 length:891 start_codon:yes stop_codon:yes gene_type:complete
MIKLLWNTHNQRKKDTKDKKIIEKLDRDYVWGIYHKKNSHLWIYEILKKIEYNIIENESKLEKNDILIIIDSSIEEKVKFYEKLKLICAKIFLFNLGDENGSYDLSPIYKNCTYVWRTFCSNKYFKNSQVKCIPIGYKSGVLNKEKNIRKYKWAFVGTPHKSSRHDLIFQLSDIEPFFSHKTQKFDEKIISVDEMSEALSSTHFIPCPNGFVHPETYRLYEALECGCIPIVEDTYNYYDRLFPNNPFIKVNKWSDAKPIIKGWEEEQIKRKKSECEVWWSEYKNNLQEFIRNKVST